MGAACEKMLGSLGYTKNTAVVEIFKRARLPDVLTKDVVGEVKNVRYQALTQQLKDYITIAEQKGWRFELIVRIRTELSHERQQLVDKGHVILTREIR